MMNIKKWHWAGFAFVLVLGTILHFTYDWSNGNLLVGLFSPANGSTWEHLKLLAVPMLAFGAAEYISYGRNVKNFVPVRLLSILIGMAVIVTVFYTYTGVIGKNLLPLDILTFAAGTAAAYYYSFRRLGTERFTSKRAWLFGWIGLGLLVLAFLLFSLVPFEIGLFRDPVTGVYGV